MNKNLDTRLQEESPDAVIPEMGEGRVLWLSRDTEKISGFASLETKEHDLAANDRLIFDLDGECVRTPKSGVSG